MQAWHAFVLGTILSWGVYVPVLHEGQSALGGTPKAGAVRAFFCVGVAYFITAIVVPLILFSMKATDESFQFNARGLTFGILGGLAGAAGALGIVMAIKNGGSPLFISPLVFAGAPVVNVIVAMLWHPPAAKPSLLFYAGIIMAACGAGLVLYSKTDMDMRSRELLKAAADQMKTTPANPDSMEH
jgi:uncharacterized membrane protein